MPANNPVQSRRESVLAAAKNLHVLVWESWSVILGLLDFGLRLVIAPLLAIIIFADVILSLMVLTVFGLALALFLGWITPADAMKYADTQLVRWTGALQSWGTGHPNSRLGQLLGGEAAGP